LIDYIANYDNIIELERKFFDLENVSKSEVEENVKKGSIADEEITKHLDKNFRVEKNLSLKEVEQLDESWQLFKYSFGEYCIDTGITYSEYLIGNRTNQKNISKLSKDLRKYYNNKNTMLSVRQGFNDVDFLLSQVNNFRLPRKKLKLVVTFNISDMFMCSTGQEWTSCLNLNSEYYGAYWYGLASIPFDKNRGMIYLTYQKENETQSFGITSEKMYKRSFFLLDENNNFNLLKWYPNEFETNRYLPMLNNIFFPFKFKEIMYGFKSKHEVEMPKTITKDGSNVEFYIYQDKTEINYSDKRVYFNGSKMNQYFLNGTASFGQFINCDGGLQRMSQEGKVVSYYILRTFICDNCEGVFNIDESTTIEDNYNFCPHCVDYHSTYCEHCDRMVRSGNFDFDYGMCIECYENLDEASSY